MRKIHRKNTSSTILYLLLSASLIFFGLQTFLKNEGGLISFALVAIFIFIAIFTFSLFAFSFFILPINEPADALNVFIRLLAFITRQHGPIIQIKKGVISNKHAGFIKNSPGLVLLDSASAAVISRTITYNRSAGPGICFTQKGEQILNSADLSLQKSWIGPLENENPFSLRQKNESDEQYRLRLKRAEDTTAYTADGNKIIASFNVIFKLRGDAGEGGSPFGYNPFSVKRALLKQSSGSEENDHSFFDLWSGFPAILVVDIWKEQIRQYRFNQIFSRDKSVLDDCLRVIQERLDLYHSPEQKGNNSSTLNQSLESKFLDERGIEIIEVQLMNVCLPDEENNNSIVHNIYSQNAAESVLEGENMERIILAGQASGKSLISNILAGTINRMSAQGKLTVESLYESVNDKLRSALKE